MTKSTTATKRSYSYDELMGDNIKLNFYIMARAGELDDETCERLAHIGRFMERVGAEGEKHPDKTIGEMFTEKALRKFWSDTADNSGGWLSISTSFGLPIA